jgi:hypothetical protein
MRIFNVGAPMVSLDFEAVTTADQCSPRSDTIVLKAVRAAEPPSAADSSEEKSETRSPWQMEARARPSTGRAASSSQYANVRR